MATATTLFASAHTLAKSIRANYPTYQEAFKEALHIAQHGWPVEYTEAEKKEIDAHRATIYQTPMTHVERIRLAHSKKQAK